MMRCAIACMLILFASPSHAVWVKTGALDTAQRGSGVQVSFTAGDFLTDTRHGWVAGQYRSEDGRRVAVFRTTDGGRTWTGTYTDIATTPVNALDFVDATQGWMLVGDSDIYRTDDGGRAWQRETILGGRHSLRDLCMVGSRAGFACGSVWREELAAVFEYHPDDREWQQILHEPAGVFTALSVRGPNAMWAAGLTAEGDYLARRRTSTGAWRTMTIPSAVQALSFASDRNGWAACTSGRIFATGDGGRHWSEQTTPVFYDFDDILFAPESAKGIAIVSDAGVVLSTEDAGTTWRVERGPTGSMQILWDGGRYLILARNGLYTSATISRMLVSGVERVEPRTGGVRESLPMPGPYTIPWRRWRPLEDTRRSATLKAACFLDDGDHAWIVAEGRLLLRTRNGGVSWERLTLPSEARSVQGVHFTDSRNGWVWGDPCIWRTTDGGASWTVENVDGGWNPGDFVVALGMFDANSGVAAVRFAGRTTRTDLLYRSPDTGVWTITEHSLPYPGRTRLAVLDPSCVWAMSTTWNGLRTQRFPRMEHMSLGTERNHAVRSVFFLDPAQGWVAAHTLVFHTVDGGRNWTAFLIAGSDPANYAVDLAFDNDTHGYAITRLGGIVESNDAGESWRVRYEAERPNLISLHWFGRHNDTWWVLAEDGLYSNAPEPGPAAGLAPLEEVRTLARGLLVWSEREGWADNGVRPNRGIVGREALFGVRWDARNADPPADLRVIIREPDGAMHQFDLRPLDYFAAHEHARGTDWGVAYTPTAAGEYAYRFVGADASRHACHGAPTEGRTWRVE